MRPAACWNRGKLKTGPVLFITVTYTVALRAIGLAVWIVSIWGSVLLHVSFWFLPLFLFLGFSFILSFYCILFFFPFSIVCHTEALLQNRPLPTLPDLATGTLDMDGGGSSGLGGGHCGTTFSLESAHRWTSRDNLLHTEPDDEDPQLFVALYDFQASGDNQLSLKKGAALKIFLNCHSYQPDIQTFSFSFSLIFKSFFFLLLLLLWSFFRRTSENSEL